MVGANSSEPKSTRQQPRSLRVSEWPESDRNAWEEACRPGSRLKSGGVASRLAEVGAQQNCSHLRPTSLGSRKSRRISPS